MNLTSKALILLAMVFSTAQAQAFFRAPPTFFRPITLNPQFQARLVANQARVQPFLGNNRFRVFDVGRGTLLFQSLTNGQFYIATSQRFHHGGKWWMMSPAMNMAGYGGGSYGGYPMMMPTNAGSQNSYDAYGHTSQHTASRNKSQDSETANAFAALGLPGSGDQLAWPLGLRILPPAERTAMLREQINGQLQLVAKLTAQGKRTDSLTDKLEGEVAELRRLLDENSYRLEQPTAHAARQFLDVLAAAFNRLREQDLRSRSAPY